MEEKAMNTMTISILFRRIGGRTSPIVFDAIAILGQLMGLGIIVG